MKRSRQTVEIDMAELRRALDRARQEPIGEADYLKLKVALDVLDERLKSTRTTEKTRTVVEQPKLADNASTGADHAESPASKGHGRNGAGTCLPGVRTRPGVHAAATEDAGAGSGTSAGGSDRVRDGEVTLQ